ncbi:hypothetical protein H5410_003024 [Solanum commersonii]|uniref:Uncharacterized protein n=1 Tax=Solanum commersonii TaxID=4109 RepID=A0A9J6B3V5_SOLCO|nr:hypothetical protein H5410_003024 [Solanum commersonii]
MLQRSKPSENGRKRSHTRIQHKQIAHQVSQHHGSGKSSPRYSGEGREKPQQMQGPQDNEINSRSSPQDQILNNEAAVTIFEKNKPVADAEQVEKEALALAEFHEPLQVDFTSVGVVGITGVAVQINNQDKDGKREDKEEREGHQNINQLVQDPDLSPHAFSKAKKCKANVNSKPTRTLPRRSGKSSINESKSFILKH